MKKARELDVPIQPPETVLRPHLLVASGSLLVQMSSTGMKQGSMVFCPPRYRGETFWGGGLGLGGMGDCVLLIAYVKAGGHD